MTQEDDEKIRKGLIQHLKELSECNYNGGSIPIKFPEHYKVWVAWLEKQKAIDVLDEEEREFADNVDSYRKEIDAAYQKGYNEGVKATLEKQGELLKNDE